jgi:hypothetical protein
VISNLTSDTIVYTFGIGTETKLMMQVTDFNLAHDWPSTVSVGILKLPLSMPRQLLWAFSRSIHCLIEYVSSDYCS